MKITNIGLLIASLISGNAMAVPCSDILNVKMTALRSQKEVDFCQAFNGKTILAVNTASNCGFTPQFKGLEALYQKYKDRGLVVVGFPSNDFYQEFSEADKTAKVCYQNYGVTFPMMEKSGVTGAAANPFFQKLIKATGQAPKWNFYKYLVDAQGSQVTAFPSTVSPDQLESKLSDLLPQQQ